MDATYILLTGECVLIVLGVWAVVMAHKLHRRLNGIGAYRPIEPTEKLVKYWQRQMSKYPAGSPKYKAYRARLAQYGSVDDGD